MWKRRLAASERKAIPLMHIVFAADQAYVRQLLVASGSAVYAARGGTEPISVHVLDCGIEDAAWTDYAARIAQLAERAQVAVEVVRHVIDMKQFENLDGWTNGSKAIWARILIPDLLPDVDRCVYSDCDILFIHDPVEMLESLESPGVVLAGHHEPLCEEGYDETDWLRERGLPFDAATHLCSGLLAMNLDAFRREGLVEKCLAFGNRYRGIPFPDQTTLNSVCFGRRALLPEGWGLFTHECHSFNGCIRAIHFSGGMPWTNRINAFRVVFLRLSREECSIWRDFETRILGVSPSSAGASTLRQNVLATALLLGARLTNLLGIKIGHAQLQRYVAAYDGGSSALAAVRRDLL